ncbi:hypothetical protein ACFPUW_07880 [Thalassorhabdus alkalitolerans]
MSMKLETIVIGNVQLTEEPRNTFYHFAVNVEETLKRAPEIDAVAIFGMITFQGRSCETVIQQDLNIPWNALLESTQEQIRQKAFRQIEKYESHCNQQ